MTASAPGPPVANNIRAASARASRVDTPRLAIPFAACALVGVLLLQYGEGYPLYLIAGACLGAGITADSAAIAYFLTRFFGIRAFGEIYGMLWAIAAIVSGLGPPLMGWVYDKTGSYQWGLSAVEGALVLIMLNCVWVALCFGILATRYRDISPLLFSLVQLLFFMTPIIWNESTLQQQGAGAYAKIIELNPLLNYLDIVRAPLLGADQELRHWVVVLVLTVVGWILAALAMRQYRARVPYWV